MTNQIDLFKKKTSIIHVKHPLNLAWQHQKQYYLNSGGHSILRKVFYMIPLKKNTQNMTAALYVAAIQWASHIWKTGD